MRIYKFTPWVIASMLTLGISLFLPFLPWLSNKSGSYSIMFITTYSRNIDIALGLSVILVLLIWVSQALSIPSLIIYFIRKQYAPIIFPLLSSIIFAISSIVTILAQGPHITVVPFISLLLAVANIVFVILIKKSR